MACGALATCLPGLGAGAPKAGGPQGPLLLTASESSLGVLESLFSTLLEPLEPPLPGLRASPAPRGLSAATKCEMLGAAGGCKAFEGALLEVGAAAHAGHPSPPLRAKLPFQQLMRWRLLLKELHPALALALSRLETKCSKLGEASCEPAKPLMSYAGKARAQQSASAQQLKASASGQKSLGCKTNTMKIARAGLLLGKYGLGFGASSSSTLDLFFTR